MQSLDRLVESLYQRYSSTQPKAPAKSLKLRPASSLRRRNLNPTVILKQATEIINGSRRTLSTCNTQIGFQRFSIIEAVGSGAYSTVYKAFDNYSNQTVAIKKYSPTLTLQQRKNLQQRELRMLSKLKHSNIVQCIGVHQLSLVMEYVEGVTLTHYVRSLPLKRLEEGQAMEIFGQLQSAVAYLHKHNVCHRDLKAENVMIANGQAKLIDFGLADEALVYSDCSGTPAYMAPEVLGRQPYDGKKADIWALGCLLYFMVAGRLPFPGRNEQQILQSQVKIQWPKFVSPEVKKRLRGLLQKDFIKRSI